MKDYLQNTFFIVDFNSKTGIISVYRASGVPLISGAVSAVHGNRDSRTSLASGYVFSIEKLPVEDGAGKGKMLKISGRDKEKILDIEWNITLYDHLSAIIFEARFRNVSSGELLIQGIEPLHVISEETGSLCWPGMSKCLTNGAMYYDAGTIHTLGTPYKKPEPYGETKGGVMLSKALSAHDKTVQSWWNTALFSGYDREGISLGYVECLTGLGRIQLLKTDTGRLSFVAETVLNPGFTLGKGQSISSGRFMINVAKDPYLALEDYASMMGLLHPAPAGSEVNGWCNWFYTLDHFSEEEIISNAAFAARYLKPYGMETIQIDEGFQRLHGEWQGNSRFPHGLKWLADTIKRLGMKPGIWIAPFVVSESAEIFREHPDWFLKNADGSLKRIGPWPDENSDWFRHESPKRYGLDITHPEAERWFAALIDTLVNNWGFEMVKIDFVAWTVFSAHHFYDPSASPAMVYRKAFEIMRKVAGDRVHLLDCGPGNITAGLINSMRIEYDQNYGFGADAWKQYFICPSSSSGAMGKRYFYHNKTWLNDADHICMDMLSHRQSQAVASLIALSGGNTMSGDRLLTLDASKLEILKKTFPSSGINAKPVDLWDTDPQTVFAAKVGKDFGTWTVAGFFNPDLQEPRVWQFPIERLWLDTAKTYVAYDFWNETLIGEVSGDIRVKADPGSVTLLAIHEKKNVPFVISSGRHVMQGALELEDVVFDTASCTLSGVSAAPEGSSHQLAVYIPETYGWAPRQGKLYDDFEHYTVKKTADNMLRISLEFTGTGSISWKVVFGRDKK
jgi:hypothetical protein